VIPAAKQVRYRASIAAHKARSGATVPAPKVGEDIFAGTSCPRTWEAYIGQAKAVVQIRAACFSARARNTRMDHVLISTGLHGVGKTALAKLLAADLGTGLIEIQDSISEDEARAIFGGMRGNDVLFWDEIHLVAAKKSSWRLGAAGRGDGDPDGR
jgi:Holliday junction resolvasome RuvABC ATP-dependent DNA helicase subunit